jgi:uncharacterized cupredoxin-like copper-binding protein
MRRLAAVLLLVASSCSGKSTPTKAFTVEGTEMKFTPSAVTLDGPGKYRFHFVNTGTVGHELAIFEGSEVLTRSQAPAGSAVDLQTLTLKAGTTYQMKCQEPGHEAAGMTGTIRVR